MLILGQVRFSKGYLCPAMLGKGLGYCPAGLEPHTGATNRKKYPLNLFLLYREVNLIQTFPFPDMLLSVSIFNHE